MRFWAWTIIGSLVSFYCVAKGLSLSTDLSYSQYVSVAYSVFIFLPLLVLKFLNKLWIRQNPELAMAWLLITLVWSINRIMWFAYPDLPSIHTPMMDLACVTLFAQIGMKRLSEISALMVPVGVAILFSIDIQLLLNALFVLQIWYLCHMMRINNKQQPVLAAVIPINDQSKQRQASG